MCRELKYENNVSSSREYQYIEITLTNHMEILKLKNIANSLEELNSRYELTEESISRLEDKLVEIISLRNRDKEPQIPVGHHQEYQHVHNGTLRRTR